MEAQATGRSHERREEILGAAIAVFGERGLTGAHLGEIAQRAGIAKGTVYLYFENKDELFRAAVRRTFVEGVQQLAARERSGPPDEQLRSLLAEVWRYIRGRQFQAMYRLVLGELHRFPELVRFYSREVSGRLSPEVARRLRAGTEAGLFRPVPPLTTARMILALLLQHALWSERRQLFAQADDRSDAEVFADIVEFYESALHRPAVVPP